MQPFKYSRPASLEALTALLDSSVDDKYLAGGQSLLASMKLGLMQPERLLDLQAIPQLQGIGLEGDTLHLGAMTTHDAVANSAVVRGFAPGLSQLAGHIADAQIRNRGTLGGSLANNDPAACWPAGVLAMNAVIHTTRRSLPVDAFFIDLFTTSLQVNELITGVSFPRPRRMAYIKFEQAASRFALVGVAVAQFDSGVRVAVTGTSQGVVRLTDYELALSRDFSLGAIAALSVKASLMGSDIHAQADYRAHLAALGVRQAVGRCLKETQ
jgi:carbon-monoxide dehydrogenase medium subunit